MRRSDSHRHWHLVRALPAALAFLSLSPPQLPAQQPVSRAAPAAQPQYKGIWEPVNFSEDVEFVDVYFVTADEGWATGLSRSAAGEGGVLLHTKDGGRTWEVQLGDPHSATRGFGYLHFIDERHGWVTQWGTGLLRTTDGENWEPMGEFPALQAYAFTSPTNGVSLDGDQILRTQDGGRTWTQVYSCQIKIEVNGLAQSESCNLVGVAFPSPTIGYAISAQLPNRSGAVVKTEDGGATWGLLSFVSEADPRSGGLVFLDEKVAFLRTYAKLFTTADGGLTWRQVAGAFPGGHPAVRFADPDVGWVIEGQMVSYTTDGGKRWGSRESIGFPTNVNGFSVPRRDRVYVVGSHGMVYRYRAIPLAEAMPPRSLPAPLMPGFASPLDDQVTQVDAVVSSLESDLAKAADAPAGAAPNAAAEMPLDSLTVLLGSDAGALPPASPFTVGCCGKSLNKLYLIISAVAQSLPQFLGKFKNNNLLLAGLRMITDLPEQFGAIKTGLRGFRQAPDQVAAKAALVQVSSAVDALRQTTSVAFQKEPPPPSDAAGEAHPPMKPKR